MYTLSISQKGDLLKEENIGSRVVVSIGRHQLNDIPLQDPLCQISRFHFALFYDAEDGYFLQDLGSRNNTYINGQKKDFGRIYEGDEIRIGDYTLIFDRTRTKKVKKTSVTIKDNVKNENLKTVFSPVSFPEDASGLIKGDPERLLLLYRISRIANLSLDIDVSLNIIIKQLVKTFYPDRIFIALLDDNGTGVTCLAGYPDKAEIKISKTVINYLLQEKRILLAEDALSDSRLKMHGKTARSIRDLQLRSVVAAPLKWKGSIRGIFYMDSSQNKGGIEKKDVEVLSLLVDDISTLIEQGMAYKIVKDKNIHFENRLRLQNAIIGISSEMCRMMQTVQRLSGTDATVLILGETGTGKDLVAKAIHHNSKRRGMPFIEMNCAAIPDNLLESELFGVIANYPGLHNKEALKGKFVLSNTGTIFLNEIGELPLKLQAKLLEVLEDKSVWPLGSQKPVSIDTRVLVATNRDLEEEVKKGNFREDLYERLNILPLRLAPLRDRKEDIPLLAGYFLYILRQKYGKRISRFSHKCIERLSAYSWPRNIRELKNSIERATIITDKAVITPDLFEFTAKKENNLKSLRDVEKDHIMKVLEHTGGNKEKALKILGITRQTLYNKGREYNLPGFEKKISNN